MLGTTRAVVRCEQRGRRSSGSSDAGDYLKGGLFLLLVSVPFVLHAAHVVESWVGHAVSWL